MAASLRDPWLWALILLNLALKIPLLWVNEAEYTDGLILLGLFGNGCPFYMPLFTALANGVAALGIDPVMAGRIVSLLAHTATLIPLYWIATWLTGSRGAGRWAVVFYMVTPVPTRWSVRVMTDSLFTLLWWISLGGFASSVSNHNSPRPELGEGLGVRATPLAIAIAAGALAALTRQTGWILFPLGCLGVFALMRVRMRTALWPTLALLLWAIPLWWMLKVGSFSGHGGQVSARFGWLESLILLEAYAIDWPLILGWPVAILAVVGLLRPSTLSARWWWFLGAMVFCILGILALQCLIQSYLFRYLLPLVGFGCILAGGALARIGQEHRRALMPIATVAVGLLVISNAASLKAQRGAWGDFREGAIAMGEAAAPETHCFTNETYSTWPDVGTAKAEWWSGHDVLPLSPGEFPPRGSLILLSSAYTGGPDGLAQMVQSLGSQIPIAVIGQWDREITPLLPDLGQFHQSPLAIRLRHVPQAFTTVLIRIEGPQVQTR